MSIKLSKIEWCILEWMKKNSITLGRTKGFTEFRTEVIASADTVCEEGEFLQIVANLGNEGFLSVVIKGIFPMQVMIENTEKGLLTLREREN